MDENGYSGYKKLGEALVGDMVKVELSKFDRVPLDCAFLLTYLNEIDKERSLSKLNKKCICNLQTKPR